MTNILPETAVLRKDRFDLDYHECAQQGIRFATAMLRNRSDAEEAVQEAFYRLHRAEIPTAEPAFRGKFFQTLRNHCIDLLRRQKVRKEVTIENELVACRSFGVAENVANLELNQAIETAVQKLPDDWRQVLFLKVHGQLSYDEIAEATGFTGCQVRTWIYRSRRQMEAELTTAGLLNAKPEQE